MQHPLARHLPLLRQLDGYSRQTFRSDLAAGLTTAIMLIPQSMAYAMLAGLDPIVGLYAATVPLVVYGLLGTSRQLAVGPVAMDSLLVAAAVAPLAGDDAVRYAALATLLALMVGVIELGMGLARIGFIVRFLSQPVVAGFTSAAALVIGLSQLKYVLGVDLPRSRYIHEILLGAVQRADEIHGPTVALSVVAIASLLLLKRFAPRFPRFLFVVVGGTVAVAALGLDARGVAIVGDVPAGLPSPTLPALSLADLRALLPSAGLIAAVAFMESISVAKKYARDNHYDLDSNQELRALGLANITGSLFSAYPVTGGFSRTAVNAAAGAKTNLASLITAGTVALTLLFLTPWFHDLPKAVLAAIIMSAVFGLIDIAQARHLWRISRPDLGAMVLTFLATLTLGIGQGIVIGLVGSLLWFVWKTSRPHVAILGRLPGSTIYRNIARYPDA
ncbi:MAG: sulfate permease, partial [Deltaproteobacteria bacterium]